MTVGIMKPMIDLSGPFLSYIWEGNTLEGGRLASDNFVTFDKKYLKEEYKTDILTQKPYLRMLHMQRKAVKIREGVCIPSSMYRVYVLGWTYYHGNIVALAQQDTVHRNFFVFDGLRIAYILHVISDPCPRLFVSLRGKEPSLIFMQDEGSGVMAMTAGLPAEYFKIADIPAFRGAAMKAEQDEYERNARDSGKSSSQAGDDQGGGTEQGGERVPSGPGDIEATETDPSIEGAGE